MSNVIMCDLCGRPISKLNTRYVVKKKFVYTNGCSDGLSHASENLDICEDCWNGMKSLLRKARLGYKTFLTEFED